MTAEELGRVSQAAIAGDTAAIQSHVYSRMADGATLTGALIDLLGASARSLGEDWEADRRDFMDVTMGLGTLQQAVLSFTAPDPLPEEDAPEILLGPAPGDDHTLGLCLVNHMFREAHFAVTFLPYAAPDALVDAVRRGNYVIAGLSVGSERQVGDTTALIGAMRRASGNSSLKVVVGGPLAIHDPTLGSRVGADMTLADGADAVVWATSLANGGGAAGMR